MLQFSEIAVLHFSFLFLLCIASKSNGGDDCEIKLENEEELRRNFSKLLIYRLDIDCHLRLRYLAAKFANTSNCHYVNDLYGYRDCGTASIAAENNDTHILLKIYIRSKLIPQDESNAKTSAVRANGAVMFHSVLQLAINVTSLEKHGLPNSSNSPVSTIEERYGLIGSVGEQMDSEICWLQRQKLSGCAHVTWDMVHFNLTYAKATKSGYLFDLHKTKHVEFAMLDRRLRRHFAFSQLSQSDEMTIFAIDGAQQHLIALDLPLCDTETQGCDPVDQRLNPTVISRFRDAKTMNSLSTVIDWQRRDNHSALVRFFTYSVCHENDDRHCSYSLFSTVSPDHPRILVDVAPSTTVDFGIAIIERPDSSDDQTSVESLSNSTNSAFSDNELMMMSDDL